MLKTGPSAALVGGSPSRKLEPVDSPHTRPPAQYKIEEFVQRLGQPVCRIGYHPQANLALRSHVTVRRPCRGFMMCPLEQRRGPTSAGASGSPLADAATSTAEGTGATSRRCSGRRS